jgi:hypothetical protein
MDARDSFVFFAVFFLFFVLLRYLNKATHSGVRLIAFKLLRINCLPVYGCAGLRAY